MSDEDVLIDAHRLMSDPSFGFLIGYEPGMEWPDFVTALDHQRRARQLPSRLVPTTFLLAEVDGDLSVERQSVIS